MSVTDLNVLQIVRDRSGVGRCPGVRRSIDGAAPILLLGLGALYGFAPGAKAAGAPVLAGDLPPQIESLYSVLESSSADIEYGLRATRIQFAPGDLPELRQAFEAVLAGGRLPGDDLFELAVEATEALREEPVTSGFTSHAWTLHSTITQIDGSVAEFFEPEARLADLGRIRTQGYQVLFSRTPAADSEFLQQIRLQNVATAPIIYKPAHLWSPFAVDARALEITARNEWSALSETARRWRITTPNAETYAFDLELEADGPRPKWFAHDGQNSGASFDLVACFRYDPDRSAEVSWLPSEIVRFHAGLDMLLVEHFVIHSATTAVESSLPRFEAERSAHVYDERGGAQTYYGWEDRSAWPSEVVAHVESLELDELAMAAAQVVERVPASESKASSSRELLLFGAFLLAGGVALLTRPARGAVKS